MASSGQTKRRGSSGSAKDSTWLPSIFSARYPVGAHPSLRLLLFGLFSTLWFGFALFRLWHYQVLRVEHFAEKAKKQHEGVIKIRAARGTIYDRSGEKLAFSTPVDSIGVFPRRVPNPRLTASLLAEVLGADEDAIYKKLTRTRFQWVKRLAEPGEAARIRSLSPAGIHFEKESRRHYPHGTVAAHLLGAVGVDHEGQAGLEQSFDEVLRGRSGLRLVQYDARRSGYASRVLEEPVAGADLVLTIDHRIQVLAERGLARAMAATQSIAGSIVVMDPGNGELLAVANQPTFDPNRRVRDAEQLERRNNYALSHLIEPGSSFKIVPIAAALEEGLATPDEMLDCQMGAIYVGSRRVRDHKPFGMLSVSHILANSSNVGTIKLGQRLEPERLYAYARKFGFGEKTGLPLPGEASGLLRPPEQWTADSMGSVPIGQEIGVTTIQLARAASVIANGGMLVELVVVKSVRHPGGLGEPLSRAAPKRVISAETAAKMRAMMEGVVQTGTGRLARTQGYRVGGKTGTAQKVDPETGTYSRTAYLPNFIGFAPVNDPSIVVVIVLDSPVGKYYGGSVAAPVFPPLAMQALRFRDVPPELPVPPKRPEVPRVSEEILADFAPNEEARQEGPEMQSISNGMSAGVVWVAASSRRVSGQRAVGAERNSSTTSWLGEAPIPAMGPGKDEAQNAEEPVENEAAEPVAVQVSARVVPDFRGMTVREAVALAAERGLEIDLMGSGFARRQRPAAGLPARPGQRIAIQFSPSEMAAHDSK